MSDRVLERYTGRRPGGDADTGAAGSEADGSEDLGAFGWLRGPRDRAIMLELRKCTGHIMAVSYGYLDRMELVSSESIMLYCGRHQIKIKGRNLNGEIRPQVRLFHGLTRNRVTWIAEADPSSKLQASKAAVLVESIDWGS